MHLLISNGQYGYKYDERANMIAKGNHFEIRKGEVEFRKWDDESFSEEEQIKMFLYPN